VRKSPAYEKQDAAAVKGEVNFPGEYVIKNKDERISDLIARAGGLTPYAYEEGAKLIRLNPAFLEEMEERELLKRDSASLPSPLRPVQTQSSKRSLNKTLEPETETIGIELAARLQNPKSKYDLILQKGDTLRIPKELQTVKMAGQLLYPVSARFDENKNFTDYISQAGGFTKDADKKRSYIVYANGAVDRTRKVLFFNNYPEVKPGAEIIVPTKPERQRLSPQAWIAIASGISAITLSIITIIDRLQ
jgi:protein involved in polysaccharide export with SLBB domain